MFEHRRDVAQVGPQIAEIDSEGFGGRIVTGDDGIAGEPVFVLGRDIRSFGSFKHRSAQFGFVAKRGRGGDVDQRIGRGINRAGFGQLVANNEFADSRSRAVAGS